MKIGEVIRERQAIVDRRITYKEALPLMEVLVQWSHLHLDNATWEYLPNLLK